MVEELVIDVKDQVNTNIFSFRKKSGKFEERLGDLKKIVNLSLLFWT